MNLKLNMAKLELLTSSLPDLFYFPFLGKGTTFHLIAQPKNTTVVINFLLFSIYQHPSFSTSHRLYPFTWFTTLSLFISC